ncbi:Rha family transcriptional regulator [Vreelandella alkaliphila]|uniref:Rha family transcriptional regulator n=1 Tax=Vreelandella alkaliphila TaxID=272774 RepID=UPI003F97F466
MTTLTATQISNQPEAFIHAVHGALKTTSLKVAEAFGKRHRDVLRKIDNLDCPSEFTCAHFCADVQTVNLGQGAKRESRVIEMDKDGFMFLVMGFTGHKAAQIKVAYINAFNWMAEKLGCAPTNVEDRKPLNRAVRTLANLRSAQGEAADYAGMWKLVNGYLGVPTIEDASQEQIDRAMMFVQDSIERETHKIIEGDYLAKQTLPAPVAETIDYPLTRQWDEWQEHHLVGMDAMYFSDIRRLIKQLLEASRTGATLQVGSVANIQEELKALSHLCQTRGIQKRKAEEKLSHIQNFVGSLAKTTNCMQSTLAR